MAIPVAKTTENSVISRGFYFRETLHMRNLVKIKSWRNGETISGEIILLFTCIGKSCPSRKF